MNAVSKTIIQIKLGKRGEVEDYIDQKTSEVNAIPGIKTWGIIYTGENEVTVIAVYENKKSAEQATEYAIKYLLILHHWSPHYQFTIYLMLMGIN